MDEEVQKSIEESLHPLYFLTHYFLQLITPTYQDVEILIKKFKFFFNDDSLNYTQLLTEWKIFINNYLGITIVFTIGLVLSFILLLITLFAFLKIFCCRCLSKKSNKLGGGRKLQACRRGFCSAILIIVTTLILACGICVIVTNEILYEQTVIPSHHINVSSSHRQFILPTISNSIETIRNLKDNTIEELQSHVYLNLKQKMIYIVDHIKEIPVEFANKFLDVSGLSKALDLSTNFLSVINNVTELLQRLQDGKQKLIDQQHSLHRSLSEIKRDLLINTPRQCRPSCMQARKNINNLKINVDYNEIKDMTNVLKWMRISINDLQDSISKAKELYSSIVVRIKDSIESIAFDVKLKVDKMLVIVDREFLRVINIFDQVKMEDYHQYYNEIIVPEIVKYGKLRYGMCFAIGLIIMMWSIFSYFGICCMTCSETTCRRQKTNRMLQISFMLILIFSWCFILVGIILFLIGSLVYFEACSAILDKQNTTTIKFADMMINDWMNSSHYDISIMEMFRKCEDNEAFYSILKLESRINISQLISTNMDKLRKYIYSSKINVQFDFKDFEILGKDVTHELNKMVLFEDHHDHFINFDQILNKEVTIPSFDNIIDDINSDTEAYDIKTLSRLQMLNTHISSMNDDREKMKQQLSIVKTEINKKAKGEGVVDKTMDIVNVLMKAQNFIRKNGALEIEKLLRLFSVDIIADMDTYLSVLNSKIKSDLVQCRPLYDVIENTASVVCKTILNPFNGFWLSLLLAVVLSIIMMISIRVIILSEYSIEDQLPSFDADDPRSQPLIKNIY